MKISVNAPSYKRPDDVRTLSYLPYCRIWVDAKEFEAYKENYPDVDIIWSLDTKSSLQAEELELILLVGFH